MGPTMLQQGINQAPRLAEQKAETDEKRGFRPTDEMRDIEQILGHLARVDGGVGDVGDFGHGVRRPQPVRSQSLRVLSQLPESAATRCLRRNLADMGYLAWADGPDGLGVQRGNG